MSIKPDDVLLQPESIMALAIQIENKFDAIQLGVLSQARKLYNLMNEPCPHEWIDFRRLNMEFKGFANYRRECPICNEEIGKILKEK